MSGKGKKVGKKIYQSRWVSLVAQPEKNPTAMQEMEDVGSILGSGKSPREGNGNPFQYSGLGNPMNRGAWCATVCGFEKESDMTEVT